MVLMFEEFLQITVSCLAGDEQSGEEAAVAFQCIFLGTTKKLLLLKESNLVLFD